MNAIILTGKLLTEEQEAEIEMWRAKLSEVFSK